MHVTNWETQGTNWTTRKIGLRNPCPIAANIKGKSPLNARRINQTPRLFRSALNAVGISHLYSTKLYDHWGEERQRNQREKAANGDNLMGGNGKTKAIKDIVPSTYLHKDSVAYNLPAYKKKFWRRP